MKSPFITLSFLICLSFVGYSQKTRTIVNPSFEFTNSGIYHASKIELSEKDTRLHIHAIFIPKWWVMFSENDKIIVPETGDTLKPTAIIGAEFNKHLRMPASGDSTIILVYPPIDEKIKTITWYTEDDNQSIYGISLDPKKKQDKTDQIVPQDVEGWLQKELNAQAKHKIMTMGEGDLFKDGEARVIGYIKGYNQKAGFSTGIVYISNVFTREDFPTVITIHPDGRFEATLKISHPVQSSLYINNEWIKFYAEPGQITCLILDWDEFLMADRMRNVKYDFKRVEFRGPLAKMNEELSDFSPEEWNYRSVAKMIAKLSPKAYIEFEKEWKTKSLAKLELYRRDKALSENSYHVLSNNIYLSYGTHLFSYLSTRSYAARTDSTNEILKMPLPEDYYGFLNELPLNDPTIVINNEFSSFINRFEFMSPISYVATSKYTSHALKFNPYVYLKDKNISLKDDEWQLLRLASKKEKTEKEAELVKQNTEKISLIYKKHQSMLQKGYEILRAERAKGEWILKDSLIDVTVQAKAQFVKDVIKVRALNSNCKQLNPETAQLMWHNTRSLIQNQTVAEQGDGLIDRLIRPKLANGYELAPGKGTDLIKGIIDPFKGKVLFIDFWATSCGPCVGGIKRMKETRERYADSENIEFIFITEERSSPLVSYRSFVKEQDLKNTYRLTKDEFSYLRELFKFNGIPRYVLIDKDGKVLNDDFNMYNFKTEFKNRFPSFVIE